MPFRLSVVRSVTHAEVENSLLTQFSQLDWALLRRHSLLRHLTSIFEPSHRP